MYEQDMQTAHIIQPAEEMAAIIQQSDKNIVIVAHGSPDGDAIEPPEPAGPWSGAGKRFVLYNATGILRLSGESPCPESSSPSPPPFPSSPA